MTLSFQDLFGTRSLIEVWPDDQPLDAVVARLQAEFDINALRPATPAAVIRNALIDEAEAWFPWSSDLWRVHLSALVAHGRIQKYLADSYIAEQEEL